MKVLMHNEKFNKTNEQDLEKANFERQKKKLIGFYLSDGDEDYVFRSKLPAYSEESITPEDKEKVMEMMRDEIGFEGMERKLLDRMVRPDHYKGVDMVFDGMAGDKHQKRILGYMTGEEWDGLDKISSRNIEDFLLRFPNPMDFDEASEDFCERMEEANGPEKGREYREAMEEFETNVYGKRYEYFKAMKSLHQEAENEDEETLTLLEEDNRALGGKFYEIFKHEKLVKDSGAFTCSRGALMGDPEKANEDAGYNNLDAGVFAVFDGAGGEVGGAVASATAVNALAQIVNQKDLMDVNDLRNTLLEINEAVMNDPNAGFSTAVVGKIVSEGGLRFLNYASVGDSRIYIVKRSGPAIQVTADEGIGNQIYNCLGKRNCVVEQVGSVPLYNGDRVVFCSDGITGDVEQDFIPKAEFADIVRGANTAKEASGALIERATKIDDRTAIVVEV